MPIARTRLRGILTCFRCKKRLSGRTGSLLTVSGEVSIDELPHFNVTIMALGAVCKHCTAEQIWADEETSDAINEAIIKGFGEILLKP